MAFTFRLKFALPQRHLIDIDSYQWDIDLNNINAKVFIRSLNDEKQIKESTDLLLVGNGYESYEEAISAGRKYQDLLIIAFSHERIGVDFNNRAFQGCWTNAGLKMLEEKSGQRILNDVYGLVAYNSEPFPLFASAFGSGVVLKSKSNLHYAIGVLLRNKPTITEKERLAYDLFSSSFFQQSAESRFLMLMMAIETLIEQEKRMPEVRGHIDMLINMTNAANLQKAEKCSIVSSLKWLHLESIGQAGRRLADCLGDRTYKEKTPRAFFMDCYDLRSSLVHGSIPRPSNTEVGNYAAELESFVGDLLCMPYFDVIKK